MGWQTKDYCREVHGLSVTGAVGGAAYTGRAIDTRPFRQGQSNVHVVRQASLAGGAETLDFAWQSSAIPALHVDRYPYDGVDDGDENMGAVAATVLQAATSFTTVGACSIHGIALWMHRVGTPAYAAGDIPNVQVEIFTDGGAGVPGATVLAGNVAMLPTASIAIGTAPTKYIVTLPVPLDLAAATKYFVVVTANYDVDAANYVALHWNTVGAGAQRSAVFGAAWAVLGVKNFWFDLSYLTFAAEAVGILPDGTAHAQVLDSIIADAHERKEINFTELTRGPIIRPVITVGAGAVVWNLARMSAILSDPLVLPTADLWDCPSGISP